MRRLVMAVVAAGCVAGCSKPLVIIGRPAPDARILVRPDDSAKGIPWSPEQDAAFLKTQCEMIRAGSTLRQVVENLRLKEAWGKPGEPLTTDQALQRLSRGLTVGRTADTTLISIRFQSADREEAARIANEVAAAFRDIRVSARRREIKRAVEALENELSKQQEKVSEAEKKFDAVRKELGSSFVQGLRLPEERLQQLQADHIAARVDLQTRKARYEQLKDMDADALIRAAAVVLKDPGPAAIEARLLAADAAERDALQMQLQSFLEGLRKALRSDVEVAQAKVSAYDSELAAVQTKEDETDREKRRTHQEAERQADIQRDIFAALRARIAREGIELEVPRTVVEIVDPAQP